LTVKSGLQPRKPGGRKARGQPSAQDGKQALLRLLHIEDWPGAARLLADEIADLRISALLHDIGKRMTK
jgi:hypothetical protein